MKIIIIGPQPPIQGGIADTIKELCSLLARHHQVIGVSFSKLYPSFFFRKNENQAETDVPYLIEKKISALNPWSWWKTVQFIRREKPDRVIFHWWTTYLFPCYSFISFLIGKGIRQGAIIHNVYPHGVE